MRRHDADGVLAKNCPQRLTRDGNVILTQNGEPRLEMQFDRINNGAVHIPQDAVWFRICHGTILPLNPALVMICYDNSALSIPEKNAQSLFAPPAKINATG